MDLIFEARCNCLFSMDNVSKENLDQMAGGLTHAGLYLSSATVFAAIERVGNWVGGHVCVFDDRVVFSVNKLNSAFQMDNSDLVVPTSMIEAVEIGKMMIFAKTVDCQVMQAKLRFRCNGSNNEKLRDAIKTATGSA